MRARAATTAVFLLDVTAAAAAMWLSAGPQAQAARAVMDHEFGVEAALVGLAWAGTGAVLTWVRPRNALGWLLLGVGTCQVLSVATAVYGFIGVTVTRLDWPLAPWSAWVGSALWLPGLLPLANVLPALYPEGRLPGPRWRWPVRAAAAGIVLLVVGFLLDQSAYDDIAPGPSPVAVSLPAWALIIVYGVAAVLLVGGTVVIWVLSAVRLARSRPPERQRLAWLLAVVVPLFVLLFVPGLPESVRTVGFYLIPVAIGVGVFRYNLLGIEAVLRRGLVYGALTAAVVAAYLLATAAAGSGLPRGPLPGVVAAALVAVGLTPLRERLQRAVDRLVYGERRDPLRAVARLGERVAATEEQGLLCAVLRSVTSAVHASGAAVTAPDGRLMASTGAESAGSGCVTFPLTVSGRHLGTLVVAARGPGDRYTDADQRLLAALAAQVAIVTRAVDLAEALEAERDRVVAATRTERDRLRRDLHDGLGPSLSGVALGLQAVQDRLAGGDPAAADLVGALRAGIGDAVGEVRRIIEDLRSATLDEAGLAGAVRRHAAAVAAGLPVEVTVADLPPLRPDVETAAYRIAQEAITNVVKHAHASRARVLLAIDGDTLFIEVADDGDGVSAAPAGQAPPYGTRVGMTSMRHRAEAIGGALALHTGDRGTTVTATLPLQPS